MTVFKQRTSDATATNPYSVNMLIYGKKFST